MSKMNKTLTIEERIEEQMEKLENTISDILYGKTEADVTSDEFSAIWEDDDCDARMIEQIECLKHEKSMAPKQKIIAIKKYVRNTCQYIRKAYRVMCWNEKFEQRKGLRINVQQVRKQIKKVLKPYHHSWYIS